MDNIYLMEQISLRYDSLNLSPPSNLGQTVMTGEVGNSCKSLILTIVTWGLSMYFVVQLMVCQMTNPKQDPLTKYNKIVRMICFILFVLHSDIF